MSFSVALTTESDRSPQGTKLWHMVAYSLEAFYNLPVYLTWKTPMIITACATEYFSASLIRLNLISSGTSTGSPPFHRLAPGTDAAEDVVYIDSTKATGVMVGEFIRV